MGKEGESMIKFMAKELQTLRAENAEKVKEIEKLIKKNNDILKEERVRKDDL